MDVGAPAKDDGLEGRVQGPAVVRSYVDPSAQQAEAKEFPKAQGHHQARDEMAQGTFLKCGAV